MLCTSWHLAEIAFFERGYFHHKEEQPSAVRPQGNEGREELTSAANAPALFNPH